jgi:hypothetical protein
VDAGEDTVDVDNTMLSFLADRLVRPHLQDARIARHSLVGCGYRLPGCARLLSGCVAVGYLVRARRVVGIVAEAFHFRLLTKVVFVPNGWEVNF